MINMKFMLRRLSAMLAISSMVVLSSCLDAPDMSSGEAQLQKEITAIDQFLILNGILPDIKDLSGVRIVVEEWGNGGLPARRNSVVDVTYTGKLFDPLMPNGEGATFDEGNIDENTNNNGGKLSNLIAGWQIALMQIPNGTKARLYIPSHWAYGKTTKRNELGEVTIPSNSTLVFYIEFNDVVETTQEINQFKADTVAIETFLESKNITQYEKDTLGVRYVINEMGSGIQPHYYSKLTFDFKYYLLSADETVIAQGQPAPSEQFYSRSVDFIQGFMLGLMKIRKGGKITVYAPSKYCFGPEGASNGSVTVPANSVLKIELELKDVN